MTARSGRLPVTLAHLHAISSSLLLALPFSPAPSSPSPSPTPAPAAPPPPSPWPFAARNSRLSLSSGQEAPLAGLLWPAVVLPLPPPLTLLPPTLPLPSREAFGSLSRRLCLQRLLRTANLLRSAANAYDAGATTRFRGCKAGQRDRDV